MPELLLDVRPDHLTMVRDILRRHVPQYAVWAFGSRVKWTAKDYSDLDLCIRSDTPLDFRVLGALTEDFSESDLPYKVDVVDWATTSESFRTIIERDKVTIQDGYRLDDMTPEVPEHNLESICLMVVDCPHATPKWTDNGVVVLRNQNIKNGRLDLSSPSYTDESHYLGRVKRAIPQAGDIVITREAPMGDVCQIPAGLKCCLGQRQVLLRPDPTKVDGRFLLFALQSQYVQNQIGWNEGTGSTVSNLRIPVLEALKIPTPPVAVQAEIATTLGALDDRIALLRETNATLEAIAQVLFKSWFVDFDPVRAKQEGREPEGMDETTGALFPDGFDESELGLVPMGWRVRPIGDVVQIFGGGTPSTKEPTFWEPQEHHWVTPRDLSGLPAPILLDTERKLSSQGLEKISSGLLPKNTVLMSSRAPIGYLVISKIPTAINQGFIAIPPNEELSSDFLLLWCKQNMESIKQRANGSTFMEISKTAFRPIPIVQPTPVISAIFSTIAAPIFERIAENERQAQSLTVLRDGLLPRLISGQLRLPSQEAAIGGDQMDISTNMEKQ